MENKKLRMNLQLFAEPSAEPAQAPDNAGDTPTVEELMTQIAQYKAQEAKEKNSRDKLMKELGDAKKQLKERMTAEEQAAEAKAEAERLREEEVANLRREMAEIKATSRYKTVIGMDDELSVMAVEAELNNDFEALTSIYEKHIKVVKATAVQDFLKSRPDIKAGGDSERSSLAVEKAKEIAKRQAARNNTSIIDRYK